MKKKKPKKKKGKNLLFQACVYSATAILVSKYHTVKCAALQINLVI